MAVSIVATREGTVSPAAIVTANAWTLAKGVVTSAPVSMFCRFKIPDLADRGFMAIIDATAINGWRVYMYGGVLQAVLSRGAGINDYVTALAVPTVGTWNSLMFVANDPFNFYLGINGGGFAHTNAGGSFGATPDTTIAGSSGASGEVCAFAIWRTVVFAAFPALHKGVSPALINLPNLVYYAPMLGRINPERCVFNGDLTLTAGTSVWAPHPFTLRPRRRSDYAPLIYSLPLTNFSMHPTTGPGPLTVSGFDETLAGPSRGWNWERSSGGAYESFSTEKYPSGIVFSSGSWNIRLTTSNPVGSDPEEKLNYVMVGDFMPEPSSVTAMGLGAGL